MLHTMDKNIALSAFGYWPNTKKMRRANFRWWLLRLFFKVLAVLLILSFCNHTQLPGHIMSNETSKQWLHGYQDNLAEAIEADALKVSNV